MLVPIQDTRQRQLFALVRHNLDGKAVHVQFFERVNNIAYRYAQTAHIAFFGNNGPINFLTIMACNHTNARYSAI